FFPNWNSVSDFLTTDWLWRDLAPAEHVLLFQTDSILCGASVRRVEDFFEMRDLEDREIEEGVEGGIKLPSVEIARTFAVETIDYPNPLGLHQPTRFIQNHMLSLDEWCPEYRLATTDRINE
ncbi:hypothetical protein LARI1_G004465, partial [Lachnellula arida]